jgi:serine/threonine protein kinase
MLSDRILHHLRSVIDAPNLEGTRYELIEEIGRGGMGVVYLARDKVLGRRVALKILTNPEEARTMASLEHPGIVPVHDAGALPDGRTYYAMKFVEGTRLDAFRETAPSLADRLRIFTRICEPVAFAHSRQVIHRDLKPENVMIGAFGEVLVLDWGTARRMEASVASVAGTRGYMAPEQMEGVTSTLTDIYSLGKVLEHLITQQGPKEVRAIAAKAAHTDPQLRYASVVELAEDAMRFLDGYPVLAYPESLFERGARWISRNRTLVALILMYIFVRALIFFLARR